MVCTKRNSFSFQVPVSDLVGKNVLLYFSAHWCPPCRAFLPKLTQAYQEINATNNSLEVIFISSDRDQSSFDEFFSTMPWLAIPFGDPRKGSLSRLFKVKGIPTVVAIGPTGKTVSTNVGDRIMFHGAKAYPFTDERLKEIEEENEKMAEKWPKKLSVESHEHELVLGNRKFYVCDGCDEQGRVWSYYCEECNFDLHPKCAFEAKEAGGEETAYPFTARDLIMSHGAKAYPFTDERLKEIEEENEKMAEKWPKTLNVESHEHELVLVKRKSFICDGCDESGEVWSYYCEECDFDLHPKCAFEAKEAGGEETGNAEG